MRLCNFTKLFILLELLDILTTMVGLAYFGMIEGNPAFSNMPMWRAYLIKLMWITFFVGVLEYPINIPALKRLVPVYWLPCLVSLYPVVNNIYIIGILI